MDTCMEVKNPPANAGDLGDAGSVPGLGRSPGGGHENCSSILAWRIPNPMDRGMDTEDMTHIDYGILFSHQRK